MEEAYYCRHGQTVDLSTGHRSRPDTELTEEGWAQAEKAARLMIRRGIRPTLIVCSTLKRAIQSANAMADVFGYDDRILHQTLLDERLWGEATGMLNTDIKECWPDGFDTVPGAETVEALQERAASAVAWIRGLSSEIVLVVGHGTIGRAIVRVVEGRSYAEEFEGEQGVLGNGGVLRLFPQPTTVLAP